MKKLMFALIISVVLSLPLIPGVGAADIPEIGSTAESTPVGDYDNPQPSGQLVTYETESLSPPSWDKVESGVVGTIEDIDKTFSGVVLWETAKEWILDHLSTVVGALMAIATFVIGLATKFSFMPKILTAFKSLFNAVGTWYEQNTDDIKKFRIAFSDFLDSSGKTIDKIKEQSDENLALREELRDLYVKYLDVNAEYNKLTAALLEATKLQCDELEDLIQNSPLTKYDLDKHAAAYKAKLALVQALTEAKHE